MTVSCLAGGAGLILSGFVNDVVLLTILRGLSGVAYGAALIFAQMAILRLVSSSEERGSVMAQYALAIVAGGIVGPALGAISAELFGYSISLGVCAAAMVVAALFALRLPVFANDAVEVEARKGVMRAFLGEWQALATALLAAIPARLLAAAVLLLLAPLYLIEVGERTSVVGRVLPLYFLAFYLVTRVAASLSDKLGGRAGFVIAGGVLSALACFALPYFGGILGAALCCALLGLGQGIMYAPMITLVTELVERGGRMSASDSVAAFRFVERVGSVFSAPLAAALVGVIGIHRSVLVLGGGALICILVLMIVLALPTRGGPRSTETTPPLGATG
jgi:MFS family permease